VTASVPAVQPDGGTVSPSPRRLGGALRNSLANGGPIKWLGRGGAVVPLLMLLFVLVVLVIKAIPALGFSGSSFITGTKWNFGSPYAAPVTSNGVLHNSGESFGALPEILGTLATSAIALIIAVPVSIGAALVIVERLPKRLANVVGLFLELLAGVPSVIVGLWGALTFGPFIAHDIAPIISNNAPSWLPFLSGDTGNGQGLLTSGLVLAVMVIPIVAATARDLIRGVPILPREGAIALGMSEFECARRVTLPWVGAGLVGAVVLGLGRALGETIVMSFILSPSFLFNYHVLKSGGNSVTVMIANHFFVAGAKEISALMAGGLVLFVLTLIVNTFAAIIINRSRSGASASAD